jgi:hypothetical protein
VTSNVLGGVKKAQVAEISTVFNWNRMFEVTGLLQWCHGGVIAICGSAFTGYAVDTLFSKRRMALNTRLSARTRPDDVTA